MGAQLQRESPNFYKELMKAPVLPETIDNTSNFDYANTLTASDRTTFLQKR